MTEILILSIFPACMIAAAAYDISKMTIPTWISLLLVGTFVFVALPMGMTGWEFGTHVGIGMAALLVGFCLFALGFVGGGDAKFLAATSLWVGWDVYLNYFLFATVAGGLLAIALLFVRQFPLPLLFVRQEWIARLHHAQNGIPYGVALAAGGLLVFSKTSFFNLVI